MSSKKNKFQGEDLVQDRDEARLEGQLEQIRNLMSGKKRWTLHELSRNLKYGESSISAQIRNMRKADHGSCIVNKYRVHGVYKYELYSDGGKVVGVGFSARGKAKLDEMIGEAFGKRFLRECRKLIDGSDQMGLKRKVGARADLSEVEGALTRSQWFQKIQRATEL